MKNLLFAKFLGMMPTFRAFKILVKGTPVLILLAYGDVPSQLSVSEFLKEIFFNLKTDSDNVFTFSAYTLSRNFDIKVNIQTVAYLFISYMLYFTPKNQNQ